MRVSRRDVLAASASLTLLGCTVKSNPNRLRGVTNLVGGMSTIDGAGVKLTRMLGHPGLPLLDPFLMLDQFRSDDPYDYEAGFPQHPHRGFETVTYMVQGAMEHRDSVGNSGRLVPGSAQWMTAGHGIVHSEMPKQDRGLMWGYQLWVNLPRAQKHRAPRYQDIAPERIPEFVRDEGSKVRVVAGTSSGVTGPVDGIDVRPLFVDVTLSKGARFSQSVLAGHTAFALIIDGAVTIAGTEARMGQVAVLSDGDDVLLQGRDGGRALLFAGKPLNEPVARSGPFVMNTEDELKQAWADYRSGRLLMPL